MLTHAFFQGLSIAAEPARPLFGDGFLSTRTEGPTNLAGLELVATQNVARAVSSGSDA